MFREGGSPAPGARRPPGGGVDPRVKRLIDAKLLELQFSLIRLDEGGGAASPEAMRECVPWFQPSHYEAVVEERSVMGVCGYPECDATVPEERSEGRYLLDSKAGKVLQMTKEASMYCSDVCQLASRRFAAGLSTEGAVFRAVAMDLVQSKLTTARRRSSDKGGADPAGGVRKPTSVASSVLGLQPKKPVALEAAAPAKGPLAAREEAPKPPVAPSMADEKTEGVTTSKTPDAASDETSTAASEASGKASSRPPLAKPVAKKKQAAAGKKKEDLDRGPLKMAVVERAEPPAPKPLGVKMVRAHELEGHTVVTKGPAATKAGRGEEESDEEGGGDQSEEEDDGDMGKLWVAGDVVGEEEDEEGGRGSIVEKDAFVQLWSAVSTLLTPSTIHYVRRVSSGDDVDNVLADMDRQTPPTDVRAAQRQASMAELLGPFLKHAAKVLGLQLDNPDELNRRVRGLLTTLDLSRTLPSLSTARYKALALLFVDACFPPIPLASSEQAEDSSSTDGPRAPVESLAALGLSAHEYSSIKDDLSADAGLAP